MRGPGRPLLDLRRRAAITLWSVTPTLPTYPMSQRDQGSATRREWSREESLGHVGWRRRAARCLRGGGSNPSLFVCGSKKEMEARSKQRNIFFNTSR